MFEFKNLNVYKKAKNYHNEIEHLLLVVKPNKIVQDQLYRASLSVLLNIAEGSGRFGEKDRRRFFIISRSSLFECVAVLDVLKDKAKISAEKLIELESLADELSRILYSMIKNLGQD